jgi:ankyrin repeat protein
MTCKWQIPTSLVFSQIPTSVDRKGPRAEETAAPLNSPRDQQEASVIGQALSAIVDLPEHEHPGLSSYLSEGLEEDIASAIVDEDLRSLKLLLEAGAKPTVDLLYYAIKCKNHAAIELLLSSDVKPTFRELELALDADDQKSAELLLAGGLRPDDAIVVARDAQCIKFLTQHGADINRPRMGGDTLLNTACDWCDLDWIETLISCGADVNLANGKGQTPLGWVIEESARRPKQKSEMVMLLLKRGADPNKWPAGGHAPVAVAYCAGYPNLAREMLNYGADPNVRTASGQWLLEVACVKGDERSVQRFLEHKADPNVRAKDGHTLLGATCRRGHLECARLLLDHKADPNARGGLDFTPLHLICLAENVSLKLFALLLLYGANPCLKDLTNTMPLDYVHLRRNGEVERLRRLIEEISAERQKLTSPGGTDINEVELASRSATLEAFNDRWGFAAIRMSTDLEVSFGPSYSTRKQGMAVIDAINGWLLDVRKPLGPVVALLELVAETAQEQNAQEMLEPLREQVRDIVLYHSSSKDVAVRERAGVLEANLPDTLRISK